jgi:hypothetical protein
MPHYDGIARRLDFSRSGDSKTANSEKTAGTTLFEHLSILSGVRTAKAVEKSQAWAAF